MLSCLYVLFLSTVAVAEPYGDEVAADAPLGWWRLSEAATSQPVADASGAGHDGTWTGSPDLHDARHLLDPGVATDGASWVTVPDDPAWTLGTEFTLEAWIQTTDDTGDLISHFDGVAPFPGFLFGIGFGSQPGKLALYIHDGTDFTTVHSASTVHDGNLHHVAVTTDGTTARFYIDGVLDSSPAQARTVGETSNGLFLARDANPSPSRTYEGFLDDVAIYGTTLSQARLQAHISAATAEPMTLRFERSPRAAILRNELLARGLSLTANTPTGGQLLDVVLADSGVLDFGTSGRHVVLYGGIGDSVTGSFVLSDGVTAGVTDFVSLRVGDGDGGSESWEVRFYDAGGALLHTEAATTTSGSGGGGGTVAYGSDVGIASFEVIGAGSTTGGAFDDVSFNPVQAVGADFGVPVDLTAIGFEDAIRAEILTDRYESEGVLFSGSSVGTTPGLVLDNTIPDSNVRPFGGGGIHTVLYGVSGDLLAMDFVDSGGDPTTTDFVSLHIGDGDSPSERFRVSFLDAGGGVIQAHELVTDGGVVNGGVTVRIRHDGIARVEVRGLFEASGGAVDDLVFGTTTNDPVVVDPAEPVPLPLWMTFLLATGLAGAGTRVVRGG